METIHPAAADSTLGTADLSELIHQQDSEGALSLIDRIAPRDVIHVVSRLSREDRTALFSMLEAKDAATILQQLPEPQITHALRTMPPVAAARILEQFPSDDQADFISTLDHRHYTAIMAHLDESDADDVRRLMSYPDDTAGGLMITEYLAFPEAATVAEVVENLGANAELYADYNIQYAYVTNEDDQLVGVLRMRDLLLSRRQNALRDVMIPNPASVRDTDTLEQLVAFFDDNRFFGVPVVHANGVLCGVVERSAVDAAIAEDQDRIYRNAQGIVGGEELRTMPLLLRSRRRLSWLSVNILLNIMAASVIALHQDTLEAVIALAVFLPIISDMSGCSGNQAVAVSMRELTLGVVRPTEVVRTVLKEISVGIINGLALGVLIGLVAFLWKSNFYLGLVVGGALMLNTIIAVSIGGAVPLLLKRMKVDPALAAGPILTTITDMCGFFIVLTLASAMLSRLT